MALFDDMMATGGAGLLMQVHGAAGRLLIKPKGAQPFQVDAIFGVPRIVEEFSQSIGSVVQIERTTAKVPGEQLAVKGVTGPQREMEVVELVNGKPREGGEWILSLNETRWSPTLVVLGLERTPLLAMGELRRG